MGTIQACTHVQMVLACQRSMLFAQHRLWLIIIWTHLLVVMAVTTSARYWKDCSTLEQMQRRYLQEGSWSCVHHRVLCVSHMNKSVIGDFALSFFFFRASTLLFRKSNEKPYFVCFYRLELW